ncbi:DUF488 family protein [Allobacillus sp. SKP2-8]|uniref:DUF488 domain-containing protein n=1 Tax=unclassified Allobacillus TaxID=2628859 RepID=UPI001183B897|nr:DUF488 family protein [Allobacillus sp. SKP2-8]TSJ63601.1 DUF488 family protein [Allobacillus sp. SKP2-8]
MTVQVKRIYEKSAKSDGKRVLVDGIWPRGVSKEEANLDEWLKEIAPSDDLRKWFDHDPDKFDSFKKKYKEELQSDEEQKKAYSELQKMIQKEDVTLLTATKEEEYNHAQVLKSLL